MEEKKGLNPKLKATLWAWFFLLLLLFNAPLITSVDSMLGAVPGLMIYLLIVWLLLVGGMFFMGKRLK